MLKWGLLSARGLNSVKMGTAATVIDDEISIFQIIAQRVPSSGSGAFAWRADQRIQDNIKAGMIFPRPRWSQ